jgi:hypothetical protein
MPHPNAQPNQPQKTTSGATGGAKQGDAPPRRPTGDEPAARATGGPRLADGPGRQANATGGAKPGEQWVATSAQAALIHHYKPKWNKSGFGGHVPGAGRPGKNAVPWDVWHPKK